MTTKTINPQQYLAVLGRLPALSMAELAAQFETEITKISQEIALFETEKPVDINRFGGTLKFAQKLDCSPTDFLKNLPEGKITLGLSDYSKHATKFTAKSEAMKFKKILTRHGRSVRILPNQQAALSTATSHHNQLSEKQNHVEIIKLGKDYYRLIGVQNITAYARRDQARPARDAKVGMLPPKLAQILINLAGPLPDNARVLDPFCGTGVVLQEAALMGYQVYGTDISERMIDYTQKNLEWLGIKQSALLQLGSATELMWSEPIDAIACETYLGPPMSNIPPEIKFKDAKHECQDIIIGFLKNLAPQIASGTPVVLACPAWKRENGDYEGLDILDKIESLEYNVKKHKKLGQFGRLLYYREKQIVAREIIVLRKQ